MFSSLVKFAIVAENLNVRSTSKLKKRVSGGHKADHPAFYSLFLQQKPSKRYSSSLSIAFQSTVKVLYHTRTCLRQLFRSVPVSLVRIKTENHTQLQINTKPNIFKFMLVE